MTADPGNKHTKLDLVRLLLNASSLATVVNLRVDGQPFGPQLRLIADWLHSNAKPPEVT